MSDKKKSISIEVAGKTITLETGTLAQQATSSILARLGDTMILATVVQGNVREDLGYFPLSVEYVERLYAGGRIKGSRWVKREGRPTDDAVLTARLIDRSIRPLFPKEYKNEVQIVVTVLSVDGENQADVLALVAVSAALNLSPIPWNGPVSGVRVGVVKEKENGNVEYIVNPTTAELEHCELDLIATQTKEKTLMLEAGALQLSEDLVLTAIEKAHVANKTILTAIADFTKANGAKKQEITPNTMLYDLIGRIEKSYKEDISGLIALSAVKESSSGGDKDALIETIFQNEQTANPDSGIDKKTVAKAVESVFYKIIRENVVKRSDRPDKRKIDEVRPINVDVSILPRTHGSAIFQRGSTQGLTVVTLGSPRMEQLIESAEGEESKRYIHHYSMPPYSVGETGRMGVPSRREIGHGALAERALQAVIPKQEKFPYTIRVVSEILSSNGSTSMAATCGSTLALMDAGVPIESPVAGIAMGMMSTDEKYVILTDILGLEDFSGDMDFKVAGTEKGVTAVQLDVKIPGLTMEQIKETLEKAKIARLHILEKMLFVIPASRTTLSTYAPKIEMVKIPVEKIGEVIGPGGRVIKSIIAETGATVDVEDDGTVSISGTDEEAVKKAVAWVQSLTREIHVGELFEGPVKRILPFGAFVEVLPGKEGMVHVSHMAQGFVKDPNTIVSIGKVVKVKVIEIDEQGRINLSMLLDEVPGARGPREGQGHGQEREQRTPMPVQQSQPMQPPMQQRPPHPLSLQFQRERSGPPRKNWRGRSSGRPSGGGTGQRPDSRFRKTHY